MLVHASPYAPYISSHARQLIAATWRRGSPHLHAGRSTQALPELMMLRLRILDLDLPHATSAGSGIGTTVTDVAARIIATAIDNASAVAAASTVARGWRGCHCCHRRRPAWSPYLASFAIPVLPSTKLRGGLLLLCRARPAESYTRRRPVPPQWDGVVFRIDEMHARLVTHTAQFACTTRDITQ